MAVPFDIWLFHFTFVFWWFGGVLDVTQRVKSFVVAPNHFFFFLRHFALGKTIFPLHKPFHIRSSRVLVDCSICVPFRLDHNKTKQYYCFFFFFSKILFNYAIQDKIHYLTRKFCVRLHLKTDIAVISSRFVRYRFSRA